MDLRNLDLMECLKTKWLEAGFDEASSEAHQVSFLQTLLKTYSELHQFPKLMSKLFLAIEEVAVGSSGGVYFSSAYVHTPILETFSKCVSSLPVGQTFELWNSFIDVYSKFLSNISFGNSLQSGTFLIAQLFASFLLHTHLLEDTVFPIVHTKIETLLRETSKCLDRGKIAFKDKEAEQLHLSHLILLSAFREVRLAYREAAKAISISAMDLSNECCDFCSLSADHEKDCNFLNVISGYLKSKDRRISYVTFKLLLQKLKEWTLEDESLEEKKATSKAAVTLLLSTVLSSNAWFCNWDCNINTLDDQNYSAALWVEFMRHLPFLMNFISSKDLVVLCIAFVEMLSCGEQMELKTVGSHVTARMSVVKFIESDFFLDSKALQTAFVTAICQHGLKVLCRRKRSAGEQAKAISDAEVIFSELASSSRKWAKHAGFTPKCQTEHSDPMWAIVQASCVLLNESLKNFPSFCCGLKVEDSLHLLKIMNCLPLEYLMPGNQMRCLLGVSVLFFALGNSCSADVTTQELVVELCKVVVAIVEGVRSIWLFDFVDIEVYMKCMVSSLKNLEQQGMNLVWPEKLLVYLFSIGMRSTSTLLGLEKFLHELASEISESASSSLAFLCLFHQLVQVLKRSYLHPEYKEVCKRLAAFSCDNIAKCIKRHQMHKGNIYVLLVKCYSELAEMISNPSCVFSDDEKQKWLKHLPGVMEIVLEATGNCSDALEAETSMLFLCKSLSLKKELCSYVPASFFQRTWRALWTSLAQKRKAFEQSLLVCSSGEMLEDIRSAQCGIHFSCQQLSESMKQEYTVLGYDVNASLRVNNEKLAFILSEVEWRSVQCIAEQSTEEEFACIVEELTSEMEECVIEPDTLNIMSFQLLLEVLSALTSSAVEGDKINAVSRLIQRVLVKLHFVINDVCELQRCLFYIILPSLRFMSLVLQKEKLKLPKQCVVQCVHSFISVKIEAYINQLPLFCKVFQVMYSVLNDLMLHYTFVFLAARPSFVPCIMKLVKAVIQAGNQDSVAKCDDDAKQDIELCAENVDRLLTLVAKHEKEFSKLVPYIIADYVDTVQHVTVHPSVKAHIVSGINRLLGICSEESLRTLAVNVSHSCREIFTTLVKNYKHQRGAANV